MSTNVLNQIPADPTPTPTGTRRRLQALAAVGHPIPALARQLGVDRSYLSWVAAGTRKATWRLSERVAEVYRQLWNQPPAMGTKPQRVAVGRQRAHAGRHGWAGPWAWDEEVTLPVLCGGCGTGAGVFYVARGIDDPLAHPYAWKRGRGVSSVDIAADFAELAARHPDRFTEPEGVRRDIAERLGMTRHTLDTKLARAARAAEIAERERMQQEQQEQEEAA